jgi:hypothetical protein
MKLSLEGISVGYIGFAQKVNLLSPRKRTIDGSPAIHRWERDEVYNQVRETDD